jgi:hypothetical protein
MSFNPVRSRSPQRKPESRVVFAVGLRVFVHGASDDGRPVTLTDDHGNPITPELRDGAEVEVVAWRPRGAAGTRYRVRGAQDGVDGWLAADELRAVAVRPPTVSEAPPAQPEAMSRPFGWRA